MSITKTIGIPAGLGAAVAAAALIFSGQTVTKDPADVTTTKTICVWGNGTAEVTASSNLHFGASLLPLTKKYSVQVAQADLTAWETAVSAAASTTCPSYGCWLTCAWNTPIPVTDGGPPPGGGNVEVVWKVQTAWPNGTPTYADGGSQRYLDGGVVHHYDGHRAKGWATFSTLPVQPLIDAWNTAEAAN